MGNGKKDDKVKVKPDWEIRLTQALQQVDELPEDACRMLLKQYFSLMHEGMAADEFQQLSFDQAFKQYNGVTIDDFINNNQGKSAGEIVKGMVQHVREITRRYMAPWWPLSIYTENGNLGTPPTDAPPIVQKVWSNLGGLLLQIAQHGGISNEVRIASEVGKRTGAFEKRIREQDVQIAQLGDEKVTALEAADAAKLLADIKEAQIVAQSKVYNSTRTELDAAGIELSKKATRIQNLEDQVGKLQGETGRLGTELTGAQTLAGTQQARADNAETLAGTQQARADTAERHALANYKRSVKAEKNYKSENRKKRAGVLGFVAASLLCVYLIQNPIKSQAPPIKEKPAVVIQQSVDEKHEYVGNIFIARYGSEVYRMSLKKADEIFAQMEKDGKGSTPDERRDYFRKQEKHIK